MVIDNDGLNISLLIGSGSRIAHMPHYNVSLPQTAHPFRCKHIIDQTHITPGGENPVIVYNDSGTFLSAVLQGKQSVVRKTCYIPLLF